MLEHLYFSTFGVDHKLSHLSLCSYNNDIVLQSFLFFSPCLLKKGRKIKRAVTLEISLFFMQVMNLRRHQRRISTQTKKSQKFSSKVAKQKWTGIEQVIKSKSGMPTQNYI